MMTTMILVPVAKQSLYVQSPQSQFHTVMDKQYILALPHWCLAISTAPQCPKLRFSVLEQHPTPLAIFPLESSLGFQIMAVKSTWSVTALFLTSRLLGHPQSLSPVLVALVVPCDPTARSNFAFTSAVVPLQSTYGVT